MSGTSSLYLPSTNILIHSLARDGIAELEDFMPVGLPPDSRWYRHLTAAFGALKGRYAYHLLPAGL